MKVYIGIDLGSTTCKAIVLDDNQQIVGKGVTNTRSNYTMATKIATHEALTNARFSRHLVGISQQEREAYEIMYHVSDYRHKHEALTRLLLEIAQERGKSAWNDVIRQMANHVADILQQEKMQKAVSDRSKFFKDFMYIFYMEATEKFLPAAGLDGETFFGLMDKSIVRIENEMFPLEPEQVLQELLPADKRGVLDEMRRQTMEVVSQVGTGYGRQLLPFPPSQIRAEIMCHARGAFYYFPKTRSVLDIGGQDTKAIQLDEKGVVRSFFMNDRCAAGCGRYLGYVAEEMGLGLAEIGPTACQACKAVPITSTCTVFAGAELRDHLYGGDRKDELLLGLHRAIVLRAMSLLARSGGVFNEFTFTGGVAKNEAVVKILRELVAKNYRNVTINIHADSIYMGALGAALYAKEGQDDGA